MIGAIESLRFFEIKTTASPPKSAGSIISNAGTSTGDSSTGVKGTMQITPTSMMRVVTMLDTANRFNELVLATVIVDQSWHWALEDST